MLFVLSLAVLPGCASMSLFSKGEAKATAHNPATEVVCLWQPAKGPGINGVPTRGFAGQIMFFTRGSASPALVDGDIRIYEFDNQGTAEEQAKPLHQFDFRAEDWQNFAKMSTLGPAYYVFIPYVRGGQDQVECTMQVRFKPKDGPTLYSDMTGVTLPGRIDLNPGGASEPAAADDSKPQAAAVVPRIPSPLAGKIAAQVAPTAPANSRRPAMSVHSIPTAGQHRNTPSSSADAMAAMLLQEYEANAVGSPPQVDAADRDADTTDGATPGGVVPVSYEVEAVPAPAQSRRLRPAAPHPMEGAAIEPRQVNPPSKTNSVAAVHPLEGFRNDEMEEPSNDAVHSTATTRRYRLKSAQQSPPAMNSLAKLRPASRSPMQSMEARTALKSTSTSGLLQESDWKPQETRTSRSAPNADSEEEWISASATDAD